jgi:hypothetical protein
MGVSWGASKRATRVVRKPLQVPVRTDFYGRIKNAFIDVLQSTLSVHNGYKIHSFGRNR